MKNDIVEMGKELAFLLRHDKDAREQGIIDEHGWRHVSDLTKNHGYTKTLIDEIVATDNKQRYEYDTHKTRIRARQGHSINVNVDLTLIEDCDILWHGTSDRFIDSIKKEGLKKMSRNYVHLSPDLETAKIVGKRHGGNLLVIEINAKQMINDGIKIYKSNNGVYLTDYVEPKYFNKINFIC